LTPAPAEPGASDALAGLTAIGALRRSLDQHEHDLILQARSSGATWQQIAASLGFKDRQAAQQRHLALSRTNSQAPVTDASVTGRTAKTR
jgi:hypothetical protein